MLFWLFCDPYTMKKTLVWLIVHCWLSVETTLKLINKYLHLVSIHIAIEQSTNCIVKLINDQQKKDAV